MKRLFLIVIFAVSAYAAPASVSYAITNITTASDWTGGIAALHWASACGGSAGTGSAGGGTALPVLGGSGATLPVGVPGAAGNGDAIVICTGVVVHVPATIGIELNKGDGSETTDGFNIRATDQTTFGRLIIDDKGLVRLHGGGSSANFGSINQYADLHLMPGGILQLGTYVSTPNLNVSGRAYFGCSDQSKYPMLECSGSAGGWVTASVGATLNFGGTLPTGLAVSDRVELSPVQQPTAWIYPYTGIDGVTAPPAPPIMPTTTDTGGAAHTCGSLATCLVPPDTILCVVGISGSTVSLGWPLGGNTWTPYCTGAEVAMAITGAGSGLLWLKKPAFVQADPGQLTWNNAVSVFNAGTHSNMDAIRSTNVFGNRPISNAAGTGPGRPGDNSLTMPSFTAPFSGVPTCTATSIQAVTAGTCYIDYNTARMTYGAYAGSGFSAGANVTYTGPIAVNLGAGFVINGQIKIPAGVRAYNELIFENVDFQGINQNSAESTILLATLPNTANNHMAFRFNTAKMSNAIVGLGTFTASTASPVEVNSNSWTDNPYSVLSYAAHVGVFGSPQYFDLSNNRIHTSKPWIVCMNQSGTNADIALGTITNNVMEGDTLVGGDYSVNCQWRGMLVQDNRASQTGTQDTVPGNNYVSFAIGTMHNSSHSEAANRFRYNIFYGGFRGATMSANQEWDHNYLPAHWHHAFVIDAVDGDNSGQTGYFGARLQNIYAHHNIISSVTSECQDSGYLNSLWLDNYVWQNNTCLGPVSPSVGFLIGDQDGGAVQMFSGLKFTNNILYPVAGSFVAGIGKQNSAQTHMDQAQMTRAGYNSMQSTGALYAGVSASGIVGNPNNIPNPEFNRNVIATQAGALYNESLTRNITGIAIQNPLYATNQAGNIALKYTYTSASNMTMQLSSDGGSTYGAAVQLNWGGSGQTYTISSVTDPGVTRSYLGVTITTTPFGNMDVANNNSAFPATNPSTRFAVMLSGGNAGQVYGLLPYQGAAGSSGNITFVPHVTGIAASDTFAIIKTEVRLFDAGGTNYVDVGIDARSIPYATVSPDTGISLTNTDYCTTGCVNGSVVTGLPNTFTQGGPNAPLFPLPLPLEGGSAEPAFCAGQAACGGTSFFLPTGSAWKSAGFGGLSIGAVAPVITPTFLLQ